MRLSGHSRSASGRRNTMTLSNRQAASTSTTRHSARLRSGAQRRGDLAQRGSGNMRWRPSLARPDGDAFTTQW